MPRNTLINGGLSVASILHKMAISFLPFRDRRGSLRLGDDRRRSTRILLEEPMQYRLAGADDTWREGIVQDFSQGGLRISVPEVILPSTLLDIRFCPPGQDVPSEVQGQTVWWHSNTLKVGFSECGVSFTKRSQLQRSVIEGAANALIELTLKFGPQFNCHPARNIEESCKAFKLVYAEQHRRNYVDANPWNMHYFKQAFNKDACTFVLEHKRRLMGTLTLCPDSELGLPCEDGFPNEVAALRSPSKRLAEVCLLSLDTRKFNGYALTDISKMTASFRLFSMMFDYARAIGITDLVIAINKRTQGLYSYLMFEELSDMVMFHNHKSLAMHMDIDRTIQKAQALKSPLVSYFVHETPPETFVNRYHWPDPDTAELLLKGLPESRAV